MELMEDIKFDSRASRLKLIIITPAHNEEETIERCLESIKGLRKPKNIEVECLVVADRCTDLTVEICKRQGITVLEKDFHDPNIWSITEAFNYGLKQTESDLVGKVDADIVLEGEWLVKLLPHMDDRTVSVSSNTKTRTGNRWLDLLMWIRDVNYLIVPLGREPRGQARIINRNLLEKIGGLDLERPTFDTALDMRIRQHGFHTKLVSSAIAVEIRRVTLKRLITHQFSSGMARRRLGVSFWRTLAHGVFRLKPFVVWGYLKEYFEERT